MTIQFEHLGKIYWITLLRTTFNRQNVTRVCICEYEPVDDCGELLTKHDGKPSNFDNDADALMAAERHIKDKY